MAPAARARSIASLERRPPPYWTGSPSSPAILAEVLEVDGLAQPGPVEVDHVQRLGPRLGPAGGGGQGVARVRALGVEVPLDEPNRAAVEDVDRGVEPHPATGARAAMQMRAKLASRRMPAAEDFSGWNWTP